MCKVSERTGAGFLLYFYQRLEVAPDLAKGFG